MIAKLLGRLRRAPEPAPARAAAPPEHDAAALLAQGNAALGRGELQEAKRCYRAACDAQPAEPTLRLNLGYVLLELGEAQEAVDALQQAIALRRPQDAFVHEALYLRGRAEQALGRVEDAIASFRAALGSRPGFEEPLLEIVPLLIAQSQADEALALADAASASTPSATSLMMRARALHALKRYADALAAVDAVLAREPDHGGALESRGNLLLEVDRAEEAVAVFESLLAARGPDPALLANLAAALRELERPHDVVRLTAEAAKQHPQHAELQLNRAIAQLTVGDLPAGWEGFEWRWHAWSAPIRCMIKSPYWR